MLTSKSTITISLLGFLGLSYAVPTPVELAPRCGTTLLPTILQQLNEANPNTVEPNTIRRGDFHVSQSVDANGNIIDRIFQIAAFQNIPSGSYGCQLAVTFPPDYSIQSTGFPTLNVTTFEIGHSSKIVYPNRFSWSNLFPPRSPPFGQGLFGTVNLNPGTTQFINSEACPASGGNLAFVFSIASWETQPASVRFNQYDPQNLIGLAGVYLTYDC